MARDNIIMQCSECGNQNYITTKNKRAHPDRLEIKKYRKSEIMHKIPCRRQYEKRTIAACKR